MKKYVLLFTPLLLAVASAFFMSDFSLQFCLVIFFLSLFFMSIANVAKNAIIQYGCIMFFTIGIVLAGAEVFYYVKQSAPNDKRVHEAKELEYSGSLHETGYLVPPITKKQVTRSLIHTDGTKTVVYDVVYTSDSNARRITPQHPNAKTAVLLLGCSHTFGEGITDEDVFAYKLGQALGEYYQVFNFGFPGYGTNQIYNYMAGYPSFKKFDRIVAYYTALDDHKARATGVYDWSIPAPRYTLQNGLPVHVGGLNTLFPYKYEALNKILQKSFYYRANSSAVHNLVNPFGTNEEKNMLFTILTMAIAGEIANKHEKRAFTVLAWGPETIKSLSQLHKSIPIIDVLTWFPENATKPELYTIKHDGHPNVLAHALMAKELEKLVRSDVEKLK